MVDQEPRGEKAAIEQLEYLKAVFSEQGIDGMGEQLQSMDINALRTVTAAAGLSIRSDGKWRSAAELLSALKNHVASVLGADGQEQAGNVHHSDRDQLCKEHVLWKFESLQLDMRVCCNSTWLSGKQCCWIVKIITQVTLAVLREELHGMDKGRDENGTALDIDLV